MLEIVRDLATLATEGNPRVTGVHLFCAGLTDISTKLFFDLSLVFEIAETIGVDVANPWSTHPLCDAYIGLLFRHQLIRYDYSEYAVDVDRMLQPRFITSLTPRGIAVRNLLFELSRPLVPSGFVITEERTIEAIPSVRDGQRFEHISRIAEFITGSN